MSAVQKLSAVSKPGAIEAERPQLRFIACGSVDDGKSTLIGRLLYDSQLVHDDTLVALQRDSEKFGTVGKDLDFALLLDGLSAEREQGITIDVAYRYFHTPRRSFIVADTPGHEQYTRNMATGASTAELAIILVDARKGLSPQTRRHSYIVSMLGVRHVVLAVNKMDLIDNSQEGFDRIVAEYRRVVAGSGFLSITAIPLSARHGDNVTAASPNMPWYTGPTLLEHLETVEVASPARGRSFRMPVQWVSRPHQDFRGFAGSIAQGGIAVGDAIAVQPSGTRSSVARIFVGTEEVTRAIEGQSVVITLADEVDASRGDVIVAAADRLAPRRAVTARLLWTSEAPLDPRGNFIARLGTATVNASIAALHHAIDITSYAPRQAASLRMNELGLVQIAFDRKLLAADYAETRELGSFILIDKLSNETVALGVIDNAAAPALPVAEPDGAPYARIGGTLGSLAQQIGGPDVTPDRLWQTVSWRVLSALLLAVIVGALTGSVLMAIGIGAADAVLRVALRRVHGAAWRAGRAREAAARADRGSGI